jgi:hypothetical protein
MSRWLSVSRRADICMQLLLGSDDARRHASLTLGDARCHKLVVRRA